MIIHFYTTVTQDTPIYQNIGVAWNFDWNVIVNVHIICLSFGQLASIVSSPPSNTVGVISVLL